MRVLFIHPNFPAQFRHIARLLARDPDNEVLFLTDNIRPEWHIPGVRKRQLPAVSPITVNRPLLSPLLRTYERGEAVLRALIRLKSQGFSPDLVYVHTGWGVSWFVRDVYPHARILGYFEWFYNVDGADVCFGRKKPPSPAFSAKLRMKNQVMINDLIACDRGISPTRWQHAQFPEPLRSKIHIIHDGIPTDFFKPDPDARLDLPGIPLSGKEKIVTYAARGMEPYRGFPQFMRSLPIILEEDKKCHVIIAGSDRVCYGKPLSGGKSYKEEVLKTLDLDMNRIHFTGPLPYKDYRRLLQVSTVHVYLTRPFVLSWSLLEAMATGCVVVGSGTEPVQEVIEEGVNGFLVDFFSPEDIAEKVIAILSYPSFMNGIRQKARETVHRRYDVKQMIDAQRNLIKKLTNYAF